MSHCLQFDLEDLDAMKIFAGSLAVALTPPMTVALSGTLGAGKTQLVRFICEALGVAPEVVTSPTYVLVQRYQSRNGVVHHLDFYRLDNSHQVWDLGFDEMQASPSINLVEWAEKFPDTLPRDLLQLGLSILDGTARRVVVQASGTLSRASLARLQKTFPGHGNAPM